MKREIMATLFALTVVASAQSAEAKNPVKGGGGGGGNPPPNSVRNFGNYDVSCNTAGSQAFSGFQNISGIGSVVHLVAKKNGIAYAYVKGLNTSTVTMLGSMQFTVNGATGQNLGFNITFTPPGETTSLTKFFSVNNGRVKFAGGNLYYIAVQDQLNTVIIPPGSRINNIQVLLQGLGGPTVTSDISSFSFTGFGGVGFDTDPSDSCGFVD